MNKRANIAITKMKGHKSGHVPFIFVLVFFHFFSHSGNQHEIIYIFRDD